MNRERIHEIEKLVKDLEADLISSSDLFKLAPEIFNDKEFSVLLGWLEHTPAKKVGWRGRIDNTKEYNEHVEGTLKELDKLVKKFDPRPVKSIRYEILDDLFKTDGPILIGNPAYSSEGLKVKFFPDGEVPWLGNFGKGFGALSEVFTLPFSRNIVVISRGHFYLVDPVNKKILKENGHTTNESLQASDGSVIFCNEQNIGIVSPTGELSWIQDVALDGIKNLKIEGDKLFGLAYDFMVDEKNPWQKLSVDWKKRQLLPDSYQGSIYRTRKQKNFLKKLFFWKK